MHSLYCCYFGVSEPLVQTQVLPYLRQLVGARIRVSLLTFEPRSSKVWTDEFAREQRERLEADGITWEYLPYHKTPSLPATVYDVLVGSLFAARYARKQNVTVFHGRGQIGAAVGFLAKKLAGGQLLFDIRGLMAEEYVDAGRWPADGFKYRLTKGAERAMLASADGFVVLTERAREILFPGCVDEDRKGCPLEVIPCCVDLDRFAAAQSLSRDQVRRELGLEGRRVVTYVGALGGWYLSEEMADFLALAHRQDPTTLSLILTQSPPELLAEPLQRRGLSPGDYVIKKVAPSEIPRYLRAADVALSFIKPCFSKLSSSPTKLAEYLASGLPVVCSAGIGDVDAVIEEDRVGVLVREFTDEAYQKAHEEVETLRQDPGLADRCRASASARFDLDDIGGARYRRLYRRMLDRQQAPLPVRPE